MVGVGSEAWQCRRKHNVLKCGNTVQPRAPTSTHLFATPLRSPMTQPYSLHNPHAGAQAKSADVMVAGWLTARTLSRTVPPAVPGVMFLSGEGLRASTFACEV